MESTSHKGKLILFPVPIGPDDVNYCLPSFNVNLLNSCRIFIVEDMRTARRNLKRMGYQHSLDEVELFELNEHTNEIDTREYLNPIIHQGVNIGLMSEAGLPCIADPGSIITAQAQHLGIEIIPLVGPSSLMMALMASGFNGQSFAFNGYLPYDHEKREAKIRQMESRIWKENQTQILIEAPYRNNQLLALLANKLQANTRICVACDITLPTQYIRTRSAKQWLDNPPELHKRNTVFVIGK